jgi:hypothetical protein
MTANPTPNGRLGEAGGRPRNSLVVTEFVVALAASEELSAAGEPVGDDVQFRMPVGASGLTIEADAADYRLHSWSRSENWG